MRGTGIIYREPSLYVSTGSGKQEFCIECKEHNIAVKRLSLCFACYAKNNSTLKSYLKKVKNIHLPKRDRNGRFIKRHKK